MPFKSKAQQRFMFAAEDRGEVPKGTAKRWAHHTKDIKRLPEKAHSKESAAWFGRNVAMPAVRGAAKPLEWLLNKIHAPAGKAVGKYRSGLRAAGNAPRDVDAIVAAKRDTPGTYFGAEHEDKLRAAVEKAMQKQRVYGGAGMAAVGIPALAGAFGGMAAGRRRRAEEELETALSEKGASVSFANQLGLRMGKEAIAQASTPAPVLALPAPPAKPGLFSRALGSVKRHPYLAAGGALGAAGIGTGIGLGVRAHKRKAQGKKPEKKKKEEKPEKKEAQLGTPFMDGFLMQCAKAHLNEKQVADVIEKAAQSNDQVGKECKAFLDRLVAAK